MLRVGQANYVRGCVGRGAPGDSSFGRHFPIRGCSPWCRSRHPLLPLHLFGGLALLVSIATTKVRSQHFMLGAVRGVKSESPRSNPFSTGRQEYCVPPMVFSISSRCNGVGWFQHHAHIRRSTSSACGRASSFVLTSRDLSGVLGMSAVLGLISQRPCRDVMVLGGRC